MPNCRRYRQRGGISIATADGKTFDALTPFQDRAVRDYLENDRTGSYPYNEKGRRFSLEETDREGTPTIVMTRSDGTKNYITDYDSLRPDKGGIRIRTHDGRIFRELLSYQERALRDYLRHRRVGPQQYTEEGRRFTLQQQDIGGTPTVVMKREDGTLNYITGYGQMEEEVYQEIRRRELEDDSMRQKIIETVIRKDLELDPPALSEEECQLCGEPLETDLELVLLPCRHLFHTSCFAELESDTCPVCGKDFLFPPQKVSAADQEDFEKQHLAYYLDRRNLLKMVVEKNSVLVLRWLGKIGLRRSDVLRADLLPMVISRGHAELLETLGEYWGPFKPKLSYGEYDLLTRDYGDDFEPETADEILVQPAYENREEHPEIVDILVRWGYGHIVVDSDAEDRFSFIHTRLDGSTFLTDNPDPVCFVENTMILLNDKTTRTIQELRAGDVLWCRESARGATVRSLVETRVDSRSVPLVTVAQGDGELTLTPGHPVFVGGRWQLPKYLGRAVEQPCQSLYNLILDGGHVILANGVMTITLAHGYSLPVIDHPYYSTRLVVEDLMNGGSLPAHAVTNGLPFANKRRLTTRIKVLIYRIRTRLYHLYHRS
jgi:hypothetical protein